MQVIIIGCGKVATALANELIKREEDVVIVEREERLANIADQFECTVIAGVPIDRDILRKAGIETADMVCAVTDDDNINLTVAQIATEFFHVGRAIARLHNTDKKVMYQRFGFETICSTDVIVREFLRGIHVGKTSLRHRFFDRQLNYALFPVEEDLINARMEDLVGLSDQQIIGLVRDNHFLPYKSELRIEEQDQLVLLETE